MASDPGLLEHPAQKKKAKAQPKKAAKRRGPTIASLRAKIERTQREGNDGPDLGKMSHAERAKALFGH